MNSLNRKSRQQGISHQRGSAQQILVLFVIALALVAMVMAVFGYKIGHKQGLRKGATLQTAQAQDGGEDPLQGMTVNEAKLKQQLDSAVKERDISLSNLETLREQNEELTTKNLQLAQVNELFKKKLAKDGGIPLEILGSEILALPDNTYEYRFDVAMIASSGSTMNMAPKMTLLNATSMVQIPLKPAIYEIKDVERIRGRFVMPKDFVPKQIKLEINAGGERVEQLYNWQVGEVVAQKEDNGVSERPVGTGE
ncbi:Uncharacterised protein [Moraxella lacunata]|uniref:Uncharacterized protein n=1 Tax=Moraxella lacunata TaxID=477 RepID=A0A1V4GZN6_MORLA|nr:hypothetical protein [Moraxella lacunata]OPH38067.1 hypothetical protein B5J94_04370 [Moraxella lacunata]STY99707.1 Uncharacterised protein [Moraxella lacunata]